MELVIAQLDHGPADDLILVHEVVLVFVPGQLGIFGDTLRAGVCIDQALAMEEAHNACRLGGHDCRNNGVVGPTGGAESIGNLSDGGHTVIHMADAFHDVRQDNLIRSDRRVVDRKFVRVIGGTGFQKFNYAGVCLIIVVDTVVLVLRQHRFAAGDVDSAADCRQRQPNHVFIHVILLRSHVVLHLGRVHDVAEDHRLAAEQLKMGIDELAQGIGLPVIGKAQLRHRLVPTGAKDGGVDLAGLGCCMNRGNPCHIGKSGIRHNGDAHRCSLFQNMNAKIRHGLCPPYLFSFFFARSCFTCSANFT